MAIKPAADPGDKFFENFGCSAKEVREKKAKEKFG